MINPDAQQIKALAYVLQNVPAVEQWLDNWAAVELDRLPLAPASSVAVQQGRCQVLREVLKALRESPTMAAHPTGKPPQPTHTE